MSILTNEEEVLLEFGSSSDIIEYCIFCVKLNSPRISDRIGLKKAIAYCLKKFGPEAVLISSKTVRGLNDQNLFPKLVYSGSAYFESMKHTVEDESENVVSVVERNRKEADLVRMRKLLQDPMNSIIALFCEGEISAEDYELAQTSEEKSRELIERVIGRER